MSSLSSDRVDLPEAVVPLCVSLDGALIKSDILSEGIVRLVRNNIRNFLAIPWWRLHGRATLRQRVARATDWESTLLPDNGEFLDWLRQQRESRRHLVLCTEAGEEEGRLIAARYGLFDEVIATNGAHSGGRALMERLVGKYGERGYDYAGCELQDLAVWDKARRAVIVSPDRRLRSRLGRLSSVEQSFPATPANLRTWIRALRLHQWAKNVLIFLPVAAAHKLSSPPLALASVLAFLIFGMCASGTYLLNDLVDLDADRIHPTKRRRPFAAGDISLASGLLMAVGLIAAGMLLSALLLGWKYLLTLTGYIIATVWYSRSLKRIPMVDVLTLAALYAVRVIAGSAATNLMPTFWLLAFTMFLFLSLAVAKRYSELKLLMSSGRRETAGRGYTTEDVPLLQSCGLSSGYISVLVMALYVNSDVAERAYAHPKFLWLLCPLLLYWVTRVWIKTSRGQMDADPVVFALRDRPSLMVAALALVLILAAV
jgi:4-hydroxybenzoate polyprenyltransferase